jgi:hypothetical protein
MDRIIAIPLILILGVRLIALLGPLLGGRWQRGVRRWITAADVAGGAIMITLIGIMLWRGEPLAAALLALIGVPVWIGTYRALPAWWRGD